MGLFDADRGQHLPDEGLALGLVVCLIWRKVAPGDRDAPPRAHLLMRAISERITWKAEYDRALLAAGPPGEQETSAIPQAA